MGLSGRRHSRLRQVLVPAGIVGVCLVLGVCLGFALRQPGSAPKLPGGEADSKWLSAAQRSLETEGYLPQQYLSSHQDAARSQPSFSLTNRVHRVRSFVGPDGWEVAPQSSAQERGAWRWRYR